MMGRYQFRLPDIGEGVAEAEIVAWHVAPGDAVAEDDPLCDVMTDKATVDMTSPVDGRVVAIHGNVGDMCPVGATLAELETADAVGEAVAPDEPQTERRPPDAAPPEEPTMAGEDGPNFPLAAPATRRKAARLGIDLADIRGTGRNGRVTPEDIDDFVSATSRRPSSNENIEDVPIIGLRRQIARRLTEAASRIPHITYVEEIDVTELEALRQTLNRDGEGTDRPKLTLLPFFVRALVRVLPEFPDLNAHFDDDAQVLRRFGAVHVGIATATDAGLIVPVLRHAETMTLWQMADEIARISDAARRGTASREELSGSTITITSLGPLGGVATTPLINRPEVAIIGPNRIMERAVPDGSFLTRRQMMNLSSSFDHRIVDGHDAARFIQAIRRLLEQPALLFLNE